ncbi:MAG: CopG family transcriptional regulator [Lachnospiraceae bacterium]|nr:CopG family transcriptional regulator [Lachnospiraceae bacterium]
MANVGRPKIEQPKKSRTTIRFTEEQMARLETYANKVGMSKSEIIVQALEQLLSEKNK